MANNIIIPDGLLKSARKLGFRGLYDYQDADGNEHIRFNFNRNYLPSLGQFSTAIRSLATENGISFDPIDSIINNDRRSANVEFIFPKSSSTPFLVAHLSGGALFDLKTPEGWFKQVIREARAAVDELIDGKKSEDEVPGTGWRKVINNTAYVGSVALGSVALTGKAVYDQFAYEGKAAADFIKEHVNPVESFKHSAHVRMLDYHDRVGIRLDRFKEGNKIQFADTIFSEKVQIREHLKAAFSSYKENLAGEKAYEINRKQQEMRLRTARADMVNIAKGIQDRFQRGEPLAAEEKKFLELLHTNHEKAMKFGARELRKNIRRELDADKVAHDALKRDAKVRIKSWKQTHVHKQKVLASQRDNTTTKWVRETAKQLRQAKKQGYALSASHKRLLDLVDTAGERRAARAVRAEIDSEIHADKVNFDLARAGTGSPTERLLARLHLVSEEAILSVKNIGRNVAEASVYVGNRADAAVQLGFDVAVDYAEGALHSAYEGVKAGAHAATVKPFKAAMGKAF